MNGGTEFNCVVNIIAKLKGGVLAGKLGGTPPPRTILWDTKTIHWDTRTILWDTRTILRDSRTILWARVRTRAFQNNSLGFQNNSLGILWDSRMGYPILESQRIVLESQRIVLEMYWNAPEQTWAAGPFVGRAAPPPDFCPPADNSVHGLYIFVLRPTLLSTADLAQLRGRLARN